MQPKALPEPRRLTPATAKKADLAPEELARSLLKEARKRIVSMAAVFAGIALLTLLVGLFVIPRKYTASTTILAQESDIIQPLLEGRAVSTSVTDRAGMARQIVYSSKVLDEALNVGGWASEKKLSPLERDRLKEDIRNSTTIDSPRPDLVQITYRDTDPARTLHVTEAFSAQFIKETLQAKERESREAYEFIDNQVQQYHAKLTDAEDNLQEYRSLNVDAQPGSATDVNSRISALRTQVEQTRMALLEQESRVGSITSQLSGESAVTAVQTRESLYRTQLIELRAEMDRLMLTFTDQHPDVVRVRHQIEDIQQILAQEQKRRDQPGRNAGVSEDAQLNPLYQELRSQLAQAQREAAATNSRLGIADSLLNGELDRSRRIAASESVLAELTRDYEVNREIYQDLLKRRENARVSMDLDQEKRGLTLRIQDPAVMPLRPSGLRLMHIAAGGLLAAVVLPLGLLFLLVRFDPRIRSARLIEQKSRHPLLISIPAYPTPRERRRKLLNVGIAIALVSAVVILYGLVFAYKVVNP